MLRWIRSGLIERVWRTGPNGRAKLYVTRAALEEFRHRFIFAEEAARFLKIRMKTLHTGVQRGLLRPVTPPRSVRHLFLRTEVQALCSPDGMIYRAAHALL
jgi:hypothetical protein